MVSLAFITKKKNLLKFLGVGASLILSGVVGWYINYALNHSNVSASVSSIRVYYDFPDRSMPSFENSKLSFSQQDVEVDNSAFYALSLYQKVPLKDLDLEFTEADNDYVRQQFLTIRQNIQGWIDVLSTEPPSEEQLARIFLNNASLYYGTIKYIFFLQAQNRISFPNTDYVKILEQRLSRTRTIRLSPTRLLNVNWLEDPPKDDPATIQYLLLTKETIYRLAALIVTKDYSSLKKIFRVASTSLDKDEGIALRIVDNTHDKAKKLLPKYSMLRTEINVLNTSSFPILLYSDCEIMVNSPGSQKSYVLKSILKSITEKEGNARAQEVVGNKFSTYVIQPNENRTFTATTTFPLDDADQDIRAKMDAKALQIRVRLRQRKDVFFQSRTTESEPLNLDDFQ